MPKCGKNCNSKLRLDNLNSAPVAARTRRQGGALNRFFTVTNEGLPRVARSRATRQTPAAVEGMSRSTAWDIASVSPGARSLAERAASRAGVTLEQWLDQAIVELASDTGAAARPGPRIEAALPQFRPDENAGDDLRPRAVQPPFHGAGSARDLQERLRANAGPLGLRAPSAEEGATQAPGPVDSPLGPLDVPLPWAKPDAERARSLRPAIGAVRDRVAPQGARRPSGARRPRSAARAAGERRATGRPRLGEAVAASSRSCRRAAPRRFATFPESSKRCVANGAERVRATVTSTRFRTKWPRSGGAFRPSRRSRPPTRLRGRSPIPVEDGRRSGGTIAGTRCWLR